MKLSKLLLVALAVVLMPAAAFAQSSITGEVSDNTGGVLPGVTVEVSSPVLIEGSRVAVTGGQGRYTIIDLRPGTYTVTFSLPGFSTVVQEGIALTANFTATINAQLNVGGIEETVTVSGQSPVVDVQSAARTEVMTRDVIDALPTPRNTQSIGYLAQGVRLTRPDVGGNQMMEQVQMISHGANSVHTTMEVDGMKVNSQMGDGVIMNYNNQALSQEMAMSTSGNTAETASGGLRLNMIPKDGGNTVSGSMYVGFTDGSWQANNITDHERALGLETPQGVNNIHDVNPAIGGPILQDKLWYFASFRAISVDELFPNAFLPTFRSDATQAQLTDYYRNPSSDHPAVASVEDAVLNQYVRSGLIRLTSQISQRNKVSAYLDRIFKFKDREFATNIEPLRAAGHRDPNHGNYHTFQAKWTSTISSRALLEVGYSQVYERLLIGYQPSDPIDQGGAGVELRHPTPSDLRTCVETPCYHPLSYDQTRPWFRDVTILDQATGIRSNNYWGDIWITPSDRFYPMASFSYVTGSHNFKVGMQWSVGNDGDSRDRNAHLYSRPREGNPDLVRVNSEPVVWNTFVKADRGIYAQDTWTIDRLTINAGVRFETFQSESNTYRAGGLPRGRFVPGRAAGAFDQEPFWNDVAPRFSVVYDLFGDAKTALKFGVNKFMRPWASGFAERYTPFLSVEEDRDWFDCALHPDIHTGGAARCATAADFAGLGLPNYTGTNGDFIAQDHEIGLLTNGAIFNANPGLIERGVRPDPDLQREYNVEWSASIQHEVLPRVSLTAAYYRRQFYDIEQRNNIALNDCLDVFTASAGVPCGDWIPFTVSFNDPSGRLAELAALGISPELAPTTFLAFNRDPSTRGLQDQVDVTSDINSDHYNGFELSLQARLPNGGTLFGGWTAHQHVQNTCGFTEDPNGVGVADLIDINRNTIRGGRFCDQDSIGIPFRHDFKLFGAYPLPYDFEFSGSIQLYSGNERELRWTIPASLYPGGQRTTTSTVQLFTPGTNYFDYWSQFDIAVRKLFRIGGFEYSGQMDIYNLFNDISTISDQDSYGSTYGQPTQLLQGRLMRLAFQMKW